MDEVIAGILTLRDIAPAAERLRLLSAMVEASADLVPQRFGYGDRYPYVLRTDDLAAALRHWAGSGMFWRRSKPTVRGYFLDGSVRTFANMAVRASGPALTPAAATLVRRWSQELSATFGYVQVLTADEIRRGDLDGTMGYQDAAKRGGQFMISSPRLRKCIPNLYPVTVFGAPYVTLFGRDRLRTAPAFRVEEIAEDVFLLQLTEDLLAIRTAPEEVEAVRDAVKRHLGAEAFFDPAKGKAFPYEVPDFGLLPLPPEFRLPSERMAPS